MNAFDNAQTRTNEHGTVCGMNHLDTPYTLSDAFGSQPLAAAAPEITAKDLADRYLSEAITHFDLSANLTAAPTPAAADADAPVDELVYLTDKSNMGNATVIYSQHHQNTPVWESGMVVQINEHPMQVIGSESTFQRDLNVAPLSADAPYAEQNLDASLVDSVLRFNMGDSVEIVGTKSFVYRFDARERNRFVSAGPSGRDSESFPLPPLEASIEDGHAYHVTAVEFHVHSQQGPESGWLALIEANTGSVLHLRSLQGCAMETMPVELEPSLTVEDLELDANAASLSTVVYFDVGDTLGRPRFSSSGELEAIDVFADVPEILKELTEKGLSLGIISDPGNLNTALINSRIDEAGILKYFTTDLIIYGKKDSATIFTEAAELAMASPEECVFVGENQHEREFAVEAGFSVVSTPKAAVRVVDPDATLAWVFLTDPVTKDGLNAPRPTASAEALSRFRDLVSLRGLDSPAPGEDQKLRGEYVEVQDVGGPSPTIPSSPSPGDFFFAVPTNDFGAVNAYHNCDRLFRILEDFGFDLGRYFNGTTFPVRVDHRFHYRDMFGMFRSNVVNASAPGSFLPQPRSDGFRFALAAANTVVGMATAWRVVLHEFGHTILWDHVGSPNFRFAHSAGDSLAAILNDPVNQADRDSTFPWIGISRSHTRSVNDFAWYGTRYRPFDRDRDQNANPESPIDSAGYVAEQILSSTMFRIYLAAGGGSSEVAVRRFAANYVAFLIFKAVGLMSLANNPSQPEGFAELLMQADNGLFIHEGKEQPIGMLRKVIRWGFERQGAYRQPAPLTPQGKRQPGSTNQAGNPPEVDVFVNDGRDGHYDFSVDSLNSHDVWNRQAADAGTVHQSPVAGRENHLYVRVSNRGLSAAQNVVVQAFQSSLSEGHQWPDHWQPLTTDQVSLPGTIPSGQDAIAGPLSWTPPAGAPTVLVSVSAAGDQSGLARLSAGSSVENRTFVPLDNNIAQRTMSATNLPDGNGPVA